MPILVTDFDGTFTRRDFFDLILERHDPPGARALWDRFLAGGLTPFAGIAGVLGSLRTDEAGALALVAAMEPPPGAAAAARALQAAGWEIVVASAGCRWYIERTLAGLGLEFTIHANPGWFAPDRGVVMEPDPGSPYFDAALGIDKEAVVRAQLARDAVVAFAGDSPRTDGPAALLVPPERRFATGPLARRFTADGTAHRCFASWTGVVESLLG
ncbi:2,3-diketo-5-methylthio-1-phosphopentane phosphatase [bacterium]|nr:2,3-diketo-5-methylthio-1-phosphopentane phosphatase [bacterium]